MLARAPIDQLLLVPSPGEVGFLGERLRANEAQHLQKDVGDRPARTFNDRGHMGTRL